MATIFCQAHDAEEIITLLAHAMKQWHKPLHDAGVRIGVLWATSDDDKPALQKGRHPVLGMIKVESIKNRVKWQHDAELLVDESKFHDLDDPERLAFCDHELSHLDLVTEPNSTRVKKDAIGRPKLRTVRGNWDGGDGFLDVVRRHGEAALEYLNARRVYAYVQGAATERPVGAPT
jgi:Putative phage metallopeptidase